MSQILAQPKWPPIKKRSSWIDKVFTCKYYYCISITKFDIITRNFFLGFIRLHILFHAAQNPIFGLDMIRELARHGYSLSPGTLYPTLHGLERDGFLGSEKKKVGGRMRKYYCITKSGQAALIEALFRVRELVDEIDIKLSN